MVYDHIGRALLHESLLLRVPGRLCFPIFLWLLSKGFGRTKSAGRYFLRIFICGCASQFFYVWLFHENQLNILFTLSLDIATLYLLTMGKEKAFKAFVWIGAAAIAEIAKLDYGAYGVALLALLNMDFKSLVGQDLTLWLLALICIHGICWWSGNIATIQIYAVFSLALIYLTNEDIRPAATGNFWQRRMGYWFYPLHLFVLKLFVIVLKVSP